MEMFVSAAEFRFECCFFFFPSFSLQTKTYNYNSLYKNILKENDFIIFIETSIDIQ